jgi:hypothetical protein
MELTMSQADSAHTTIPSGIHFASADAVRRTRPAPKPTELATAFAVLKAHIAAFEQPFEPRHEAGPEHLEDWAEHVDQLLEATRQYTRAVVAHLDDVAPGGVDDETGGLADAASDVVGALRKAAESRRLDNAA